MGRGMTSRRHLTEELHAAARALEAVATEVAAAGSAWHHEGADPATVAWAARVAAHAAWWSTRLDACAGHRHR